MTVRTAKPARKPVIWLWLAGWDLDGVKRTDATWRHDATEVLVKGIDGGQWTRTRRRRRSAIRQGGILMAVVTGWDLWYHLADTLAILAALAALLAFHGALRGGQAVMLLPHRRKWVQPLQYALTRELGTPPTSLEVSRSRDKVVVGLPPEFTGSSDRERQAIAAAVTAKLAIEAPDPDWSKLHGRNPQVTFTQSEPPPTKVGPPAVLPAIQAAAGYEVILGRGRKNVIVKGSLDEENPHWGESMRPGDGKSELAKNIGCQVLYHGGLLLILDYKLISHMWSRGLPNVAYAGTPYEIHVALMWLQEEIMRRNAAALASADIDGHVQGDVGPRILVIAEELNATQNRLTAWWRQQEGTKGRPPSSEALDEALFIGRQVRVNVLMIGQRLSAKASGSGDARENVSLRIMCDPSPATWKMLGYDHAQPPAAGHPGRYQVVTPKAVREVQGTLWTAREARDFATSGTVAVPRYDMPFIGDVAPVTALSSVPHGTPDQAEVSDNPGLPPRPQGTATIREALDAGLFGRSDLQAARKRVQRAALADAGWDGNSKLYALEDLKELAR